MIILWIIVFLGAVWVAHWGAEKLSEPLRKLRKQWGFSVAAGGALVGLAAASPEIGINATSALSGEITKVVHSGPKFCICEQSFEITEQPIR